MELEAPSAAKPHRTKIIVPGNHDRLMGSPYVLQIAKNQGVRIVIDETVRLPDGTIMYGSPWTPQIFSDPYWGWELPRNSVALGDKWRAIPENTEILVTHGPPKHVLDTTRTFEAVGCQLLADETARLPRLRHHIFGHIHEQGGQSASIRGMKFHNVAVMDANYRLARQPTVIDF